LGLIKKPFTIQTVRLRYPNEMNQNRITGQQRASSLHFTLYVYLMAISSRRVWKRRKEMG